MLLSDHTWDYSHTVYDTATETNNAKLQLLQTRAASLITGSGPRTGHNSMLGQLGWLSLQHRQDLHKCTVLHKCPNNLAPLYLYELFSTNSDIHFYDTCPSVQLRAFRHNIEYYTKVLHLSDTNHIWNN